MAFDPQYCLAYVLMDVFCIILAVVASANVQRDSGSETQVRYFFLLITAYQVFALTDLVWATLMFSGLFPNTRQLLVLVDGVNKVSAAFTAYFWFCFTLARFESRLVYNRKLRWVSALPVVAVPILYVIGFLNNLNIRFNEDGSIANGPTYLAISGVALLYLLAATIYAFRCYRRSESSAERRTTLVFMAFVISPVFGAVFDAFVPNTPILAPTMLISIVLVLMSLQESRISSDALTGLNNRRRADAFLDDSLAHVEEGHPLYLFIIDMNRFKQINDTYGHLEGDHALQLMAAALKKACAELDAFAARWGGDEFVMICAHGIEGNPKDAAELVKSCVADEVRKAGVSYNLTCTIGFACSERQGETSDHLVRMADESLYDAKSRNRIR